MNKKIFAVISLLFILAMPVMGLAVEFGNPPEIRTTPNANDANFFFSLAGIVLDIIWIALIAFAVIMFIVAGFQFLSAQGEPEGVKKAQKSILWGSIGVTIAILAFTIPFFIKNVLAPILMLVGGGGGEGL